MAVPVAQVLQKGARAWRSLPGWVQEAYEDGKIVPNNGFLIVETLEGAMKGNAGDWLIRGTKGELYPCKPDIFAQIYERV